MVTNTTDKKQVTLSGSPNSAIATLIHVQNSSDIKVIKTSSGVDTDMVETTNYTVTDVGVESGCTVTPIGATAGDVWTIKRNVPLTQSGDYVSNSKFPPEVNEDGHDKSRMIDQQQQEELVRALKFPESEVETAGADELPLRAARLTKVLGFDAVGDLTVYDQATFITDLAEGKRTYNMTAGSSVTPAITVTSAANTAYTIRVYGNVTTLGSIRERIWHVADVAGTLYVSNVDNILSGKSGAEAVDFSTGAIGGLLNITLDGSALTSTVDVDVKVELTTIGPITDASFVFKP